MDLFNKFISMLTVRGYIDTRCYFGAPWGYEQNEPSPNKIPYHIILSGEAILEDKQSPPTKLSSGDIVLYFESQPHKLSSGENTNYLPTRTYLDSDLWITTNDSREPVVDMICGHFILDAVPFNFLSSHLPKKIIIKSDGNLEQLDKISILVKLIRAEILNKEIGYQNLIGLLSTILFSLILRQARQQSSFPKGILSLLNNSRLTPALSAMLECPQKNWDIEYLASLCHMSRSTFIRSFKNELNLSAKDYLIQIRMTIAAQNLKKTTLSIAEIAESVGYQSEAAFYRTFKKHMKHSPSHWRNYSLDK